MSAENQDLINEFKWSLGSDLVADTTAETKSAVVDLLGFDGVTFVVKLGDVDAAAVMTFTVKSNTANSTTSPTPATVTLTDKNSGSTITSGALVLTESSGSLDDKIILITVSAAAVGARYCFLSITAAVESYEVDFIGNVMHGPRTQPVTQSSDVVATAFAA